MIGALGLLGGLTEPFDSELVRAGAAAAIVVAVLCGAVGSLVVVRGMALLADSYAHGVLPGVAVAVLLAGSASDPSQAAILAGGLAGGIVTAGGTALILRRGRLREDTAAAVMFVLMLALGVVLISRVENFAVDLTAFLFGDLLAADPADLPLTIALAAVVLGAFALLYRPIALVSFDRRRAAAAGLAVERVELATMVLLAVTVVIGFRVVGALLVLGLLVAPPAAAAALTRRLPAMIAVSVAIAVISVPIGLLVSWHLEVAAAAAVVLVAVAICVAVLVLSPASGRAAR